MWLREKNVSSDWIYEDIKEERGAWGPLWDPLSLWYLIALLGIECQYCLIWLDIRINARTD